jgi:hypothetical protein
MTDRSLPPVDPVPVDIKTRRRTLYLLSVLLALETLGLVGVSVYAIGRIDWESELEDVMISVEALETIALSLLLLPLAVVTGITAAGFLRIGRGAWLRAMVIQGIILTLCLWLYMSGLAHRVVYAGMLYAILIVWYLNTNEVRSAFYARKHVRKPSEQGS